MEAKKRHLHQLAVVVAGQKLIGRAICWAQLPGLSATAHPADQIRNLLLCSVLGSARRVVLPAQTATVVSFPPITLLDAVKFAAAVVDACRHAVQRSA